MKTKTESEHPRLTYGEAISLCRKNGGRIYVCTKCGYWHVGPLLK